MVEKIRERIPTKVTIVELVTLVAEEIDAMAGELAGRLKVIKAELGMCGSVFRGSTKPWRPAG